MSEQQPSIAMGQPAQSDQPMQEAQANVEHDIQQTYNCFVQLQKDLQFVQMLSHPEYIIQLHQRGYLYDQKFIRYLEGLKYLNNEKYITLIKYPEGLLNLERIKSKGFAEYLKNTQNSGKFKSFCLKRNQLLMNSSR